MCKLAAFPPGFSRTDALAILEELEGANRDGVGSAYVREDGRFMIEKYAGSLTGLLSKPDKEKFLAHMPYKGWTIVHLRLATHGAALVRNTHPFIAGEWCVAHNGVWYAHKDVRLALKRSVKFYGETDSETAAHLLNIAGPKKFTRVVTGGVFLALNRSGQLWVLKTSGALDCLTVDGKELIATSLGYGNNGYPRTMKDGWYRYRITGTRAEMGMGAGVFKYREESPNYAESALKNLPSANPPNFPSRFGSDGFPQRSRRSTLDPDSMTEEEWREAGFGRVRDGKVEVPRDPDVTTYDERGYPHYAGQMEAHELG